MKAAVWKRRRYEPSVTLLMGFLLLIGMGTLLLMLPISAQSGRATPLIDALFTAASATCVTGQTVVNTYRHWSDFGKVVIITLIQIGGLGFITFVTGFFMLLGRKMTLKDRLKIQAAFGRDRLDGMVRLVRDVALGTFIIEGAGALILFLRFVGQPGESLGSALAKGVFHSISAFCNAGFDILGEQSLMAYARDPVVSIVIMTLIILGGIGFSVWIEITRALREKLTKTNFSWKILIGKFSVNSKLALLYTGALIAGGALFFFLAEYKNAQTLGTLSLPAKVLASFFQSVTARTTGFHTISQAGMTDGSKLMSAILMFIGGSPGGTAGGVKTVTLAVLLCSCLSVLRGKKQIEAFGRSIPLHILQKALAVFTMLLATVIVSTMILTFSESSAGFSHHFLDILVEAVSACSTAGFATGITPQLSIIGKCTLMVCMFIGRIGPITVAVGMTIRLSNNENHIHYPEEKVFVG